MGALQNIYDTIKSTTVAVDDLARTRAYGLVMSKMDELATRYTILEQRNHGLQKALNLNKKAAAELGYALDSLNGKFNPEKLRVYVAELNGIFKGFSGKIAQNKQMLAFYDKLRNNLQLSADQATALTKAQSANNKLNLNNIAQYVDAIQGATGQTGQYTEVLEQIADAGALMRMAYAKSGKEITKAAFKANLLGTNFKEMAAMSEKFLDIESSIGSELEMQLLTGKQINTDKIRSAALSQDLNAQADALREIMETLGDDAMNDPIKRQAIVNFMGLEADRVAEIYEHMKATGNEVGNIEQKFKQIDESTMSMTDNIGTSTTKFEEMVEEENKLSTAEELRDKGAQGYAATILTNYDKVEKLTGKIETVNIGLKTANQSLLEYAGVLSTWLAGPAGKTLLQIAETYEQIKKGVTETTEEAQGAGTLGGADVTQKSGKDVYISAANANAIYSAKENTLFNLSPRDEIAAAPGLGAALTAKDKGGNASFNVYVTNKFELDQLITAVDIRRSERMNS